MMKILACKENFLADSDVRNCIKCLKKVDSATLFKQTFCLVFTTMFVHNIPSKATVLVFKILLNIFYDKS